MAGGGWASLCVGLALCLAAAQAQSLNFTHTFTGGLPFCTQCGSPGVYACSPDENGSTIGKWGEGKINFRDSVPFGGTVTAVKITLRGAWTCDPDVRNAMWGIKLNGITHAVRETTKGSNNCQCNTCDGSEVHTISFANGVPGYVYSGNNVLQIDTYRNNICLHEAFVELTYSTSEPLPTKYHEITIPEDYNTQNCGICNKGRNQWCSNGSNTTLNLEFKDNAPAGATVVGFTVHTSHNFVQRAYNSQYSTLYIDLDGTSVESRKLSDVSWRNVCGCYADQVFESTFYQRGWPDYVVGGINTVTFRVSKYSTSYGNICLGRVGVNVIYYILEDGVPKFGSSVVKM